MDKNKKIYLVILIILIFGLASCYVINVMDQDSGLFNNHLMFKPTIGIISALDSETEVLVDNLNDPEIREIAGSKYYYGDIGNYHVVIVRCGVGKVSAAACTQVMISTYSPDCIINTGAAGSLSPDLNVGDIVISNSTAEWDLDTTDLGNPKGYVSSVDKVLMIPSPEAMDKLKSVIPSNVTVKVGLIVSSDQFVSTNEQRSLILNSFPNALCADMEGASIGHVCTQNNVSFCVIRCISDNANGDSDVDYDKFSKIAGEKSAKVILHLLRN